jgi:putative Mg2+ transporter-C (MgtC) family protein
VGSHVVGATDFGLRLLFGGLLGVAIGFERQWRQRGAGLHTSALVATGAALFALLSPVVGADSETRVLANIVTGVGFLAGGVILRQGTSVTGLNTAATIWATAAVGALAGVGLYREAAMGAAAIIIFNLSLQPLVTIIDSRSAVFHEQHGEKVYSLQVTCDGAAEAGVRSAIIDAVSTSKLQLRSLHATPDDEDHEIHASLHLLSRDDGLVERMAASLTKQPGVRHVTWGIADST